MALATLRTIAGTLFFIVGGTYLGAYLLWQTGTAEPFGAWWLAIMDLPFIAMGLLYGALSLHLSVRNPEKPSHIQAWIIGFFAAALFLLAATLNYWEVLGLPLAY